MGGGCKKMAVCGSVRQNEKMVYGIADNKLREEMKLTWSMLEGGQTRTGSGVAIKTGSNSFFDHKYSFEIASSKVGTHIVQVLFDGVEVPSSPVLLDVKEV